MSHTGLPGYANRHLRGSWKFSFLRLPWYISLNFELQDRAPIMFLRSSAFAVIGTKNVASAPHKRFSHHVHKGINATGLCSARCRVYLFSTEHLWKTSWPMVFSKAFHSATVEWRAEG